MISCYEIKTVKTHCYRVDTTELNQKQFGQYGNVKKYNK